MQGRIEPMSLGDVFDRLFKLIGRTAIRNLVISTVIVLPAALILARGLQVLFSTLAQVSRLGDINAGADVEQAIRIFGAVTVYFGSILIFLLATFAAMLGVTLVGCSEIAGQEKTWRAALRETFSMLLLRVYGQAFLQYLLLASVILFPYSLIVAGTAAGSSGLAATGGLLILPAIVLAVHLWVRWAFAIPVIAFEGAGVLQSFRRSSLLVRGLWWRTVGILLLLNLVTQFAISIITTPINLIALWGFFSRYYSAIESAAGAEIDPLAAFELFASLGPGLGVVIFVSSVLLLLVTPLINTVMYFDLRARKAPDEPELALE